MHIHPIRIKEETFLALRSGKVFLNVIEIDMQVYYNYLNIQKDIMVLTQNPLAEGVYMSRTETVILTNMCMVYDGNKVLVQDKADPKYKGATFPGGHVEKGESFTDAVIREVFEETGLTIAAPRLCGIKSWMKNDGTRYMVLLYKTDRFAGELKSSEEGEVFWADLNEFMQLELAGGMEDMLRVFLEEDLSEFYYYKEDDVWKYCLK